MSSVDPSAPSPIQCSTPGTFVARGCTSMHFGENQLSPHSISFSLLSTPHPSLFQQALVRSSIRCYPDFNLDMDRSCGFGSMACDWTPYSDSVSLRLRTLQSLTSPQTITRRLIFQEAHRHPTKGLRLLVGTRFQVYFTPRQGCFSPFPLGTASLSVARRS